jgi:pre-mRNA-processing factor SLU7
MSVWGSWYDRDGGRWGFACCHSTTQGSYCVGSAGIAIASSSTRLLEEGARERVVETTPPKSLVEKHLESSSSAKGKRKADGESDEAPVKRRLGEGDIKLDSEKLERSLRDEEKRLGGADGKGADERSQKYNSLQAQEITEEDIEAYRRKRTGYEDPMANLAEDELLPL